MALITTDSAKCDGTLPAPKEPLPNPQPGNVYVVQLPSCNSIWFNVIGVFKTGHSLERFFKGAMLAQIRYQGHPCRIEDVRGWYTVTEKRVEA